MPNCPYCNRSLLDGKQHDCTTWEQRMNNRDNRLNPHNPYPMSEMDIARQKLEAINTVEGSLLSNGVVPASLI